MILVESFKMSKQTIKIAKDQIEKERRPLQRSTALVATRRNLSLLKERKKERKKERVIILNL